MSAVTWAYAARTSVAPDETLCFHLNAGARGRVRVDDAITGVRRGGGTHTGPEWRLSVPGDWPSSLYVAVFDPGEIPVYFVVRPARPADRAPILVSVPFLTWQAYNNAGVPGEGLYPAQSPRRATRVSFDRPGGGPAGHWEDRFYRWLGEHGYAADYCSNLDLHHDGARLLRDYRLLVCAGHDEYWTWEMRDAVEGFVAGGGNTAFLCGNTCWWQVRLEDAGRTVVCHRDAFSDPVAATDPARTTVEWSSSPVNRPENTLTGVSFRNGAGCWENMDAMAEQGYTVGFADHWAFDGTGLRDGDTFGLGAVGYETDAAEYREVDGVPLATGGDGTSPDFVILARAELGHWRRYGQGGRATMGILRTGGGTVFNAATVGWSNALDDEAVSRITRNVLDRLSGAAPAWEPMGRSPVAARTLAGGERRLFAAMADDTLRTRPDRTQNLPWRTVDSCPGLRALAAPNAAVPGGPVALYGLFHGGRIRRRDAVDTPAEWEDLYPAPTAAVDLHPVDEEMYCLAGDGGVWHRPLDAARGGAWTRAGTVPEAVALTGMNGRLFAITAAGRLLSWAPLAGAPRDLGPADGLTCLAALGGRLIGADAGGSLVWRDASWLLRPNGE